jgi:hypothetical protein
MYFGKPAPDILYNQSLKIVLKKLNIRSKLFFGAQYSKVKF